MKTKLLYVLSFLFFAGMLMVGCEQSWNEGSLELESDVTIQSFVVDGVEGEIDHESGTITVNLPRDAEENGLAPEIEIPQGASVTPASGSAVNFGTSHLNPVKFRVENGNVYREYRAVVKGISASISQFMVGDRVGVIDHAAHTIHVVVPEGTDLTQVQPNITFTEGAEMEPASGSIVDFTEAVIYTLSYLGEVFEYSVVVEVGEEVVLPLTIYNGQDVVPSWWTVGSAGDISSQFENPLENSVNPTQYCASIWRNGGDDPWTGGGLGGLNIDPTKYLRFQLLVLKDAAGDVQMEIQGDGADNQYLRAMYTEAQVGEWQLLEFVLPADHGFTKIHTLLVAPHIDDTKGDASFVGHRMYWDELIAYPAE